MLHDEGFDGPGLYAHVTHFLHGLVRGGKPRQYRARICRQCVEGCHDRLHLRGFTHPRIALDTCKLI